ncbi:MAG: VTT domain-containing protein [Firmicutes bacterium]|nr:VTT domain-containing protein [Bacillota bacterium]
MERDRPVGYWAGLLASFLVSAVRTGPGLWYALVFLAFLAEGTGIPFVHLPAVVLFLAVGYLVAVGRVSLVWAVAAAALGSTVGAYITYRVGARLKLGSAGQDGGPEPPDLGGTAVAAHLLARREQLSRLESFVGRHGAWVALAARWLGLLRPAALLAMGAAGLRPVEVLPGLLIGSLAYCGLYQLLAAKVGRFALAYLSGTDPVWLAVSFAGLALVWAGGILLFRKVWP